MRPNPLVLFGLVSALSFSAHFANADPPATDVASGEADIGVPAGLAFERPYVVQAIYVDPNGRDRGLILDDGTVLVGINAGLAAASARPGDRVAISVDDRNVVHVANTSRGETATFGPREAFARLPVSGPPVGGGPIVGTTVPARGGVREVADLERIQRAGRVRLVLQSPAGVPSGVLLDDGTQIHLLPRVSAVLRSVRVGDHLEAVGLGSDRVEATAVWALTITRPNGQTLLDLTRGPIQAPELGLRPPDPRG
jgi:hypothetical protein